jgi:hypothetical protein
LELRRTGIAGFIKKAVGASALASISFRVQPGEEKSLEIGYRHVRCTSRRARSTGQNLYFQEKQKN